MDERLEKLKKGEIVQRLITYQGKRIVEHFQPNREIPGTYKRYFMPSNRDHSQAIEQNYALSIEEVEQLLNTKSE